MLEQELDDRSLRSGPDPVEDEPTMVLRKRARSRPVAMSDRMTAVLTVLEGERRGEVIELRHGNNVVGRGREVDVYLGDRGMSRQHARLMVGTRCKVELLDLASTNGTFVNGERVTSESLRVGDRIRFGLEAVLELSHVHARDLPKRPSTPERETDAPRPRQGRAPLAEGPNGTAAEVSTLEPNTPCWGDSVEAIDAYARLLEIRRKRLGDDHPSVAEMLETMGAAFKDNGRAEQALEYLGQALEIHQRRTSPNHRSMARTLTRIAHCELALSRPAAAVTRLEQAEELLDATRTTPMEIGCARFYLARLLWSLGRERARCLTLARQARDAFADGGPTTRVLHQDAQTWLRSIEGNRFDLPQA